LLRGVPRKKEPQLGLAWAIKKTRVEAEVSQSTLAERMEVDPSQVSRLEKGGNPSWGMVRRAAYGLDVELEELCDLAEDFERRRQGRAD
jgi:transcriptional regulator with XRE-family HTH domain